MQYLGEIISLVVAVSWTFAALFSEGASKRLGTLPFNIIRMVLSIVLLSIGMWMYVGSPLPMNADNETWLWLILSGLVGYVFGDICLFNAYLTIGSRFGQLLMTLAPIAAAMAGWCVLGEGMSWKGVAGMCIVVSGIALSVLNRGTDAEHHRRLSLKLPLRGVLYGIGAGVGQGVGLVLSKVGMNAYEMHIKDVMKEMSSLGTQQMLEPMRSELEFMPFTATWMRAVAGLVGFIIVMTVVRQWRKLPVAVSNRRGMACALGAVITGPTIGVSLSLMATLYTSAGVAQTLMSLTPIIILVPTYYIYKQRVTPMEVLGAVIAVAGASLFFI